MDNINIRDNLLVTAGTRAAYMDAFNVIDLPSGVDGEDEIASEITNAVDKYLEQDVDESFDIYIEEFLIGRFKRYE